MFQAGTNLHVLHLADEFAEVDGRREDVEA
jgi:hypothetical protein